jgi:hypothetical protein
MWHMKNIEVGKKMYNIFDWKRILSPSKNIVLVRKV